MIRDDAKRHHETSELDDAGTGWFSCPQLLSIKPTLFNTLPTQKVSSLLALMAMVMMMTMMMMTMMATIKWWSTPREFMEQKFPEVKKSSRLLFQAVVMSHFLSISPTRRCIVCQGRCGHDGRSTLESSKARYFNRVDPARLHCSSQMESSSSLTIFLKLLVVPYAPYKRHNDSQIHFNGCGCHHRRRGRKLKRLTKTSQ